MINRRGVPIRGLCIKEPVNDYLNKGKSSLLMISLPDERSDICI